MKTSCLASALLLLAGLVSCNSAREAVTVETYSLSSPDGTLQMEFTLDDEGVARYSLTADGTPILNP